MKQIVLLMALATCFAFKAKAQTGATERTVVVDNSKIKVTEFLSQPGQDVCGKGVHSHPDQLTVLLTDATVTITKAGSQSLKKRLLALPFGAMPKRKRWLTAVNYL